MWGRYACCWTLVVWIMDFRGLQKNLHLFALATGIGRSRDPFPDTVSETFLQDVCKNEDPLDPP